MFKHRKLNKKFLGSVIFLFLIAFTAIDLITLGEENKFTSQKEDKTPQNATNNSWDTANPITFGGEINFSIGNNQERWYSFELNSSFNNYSLAITSLYSPNTTSKINLSVYGPDNHIAEVGNYQKGIYSDLNYLADGSPGLYYVNISTSGIDYMYEGTLRLFPHIVRGGESIDAAEDIGKIFKEGNDNLISLDQDRFFRVDLPAHLNALLHFVYPDFSNLDYLQIFAPDKTTELSYEFEINGVSLDDSSPFILLDAIRINTTEDGGPYYLKIKDQAGQGGGLLSIIFDEGSSEDIFEYYTPNLEVGVQSNSETGFMFLDWDDHSQAEEYYIYRDTEPITDVSGKTEISISTESTYQETLSEDDTYYYCVVAAKNNGETFSQESNVVSFEVSIVWLYLNEEFSNSSMGYVDLYWTTQPEAEEYYIYRDTAPITDLDTLQEIEITTKGCMTDSIDTNGTYYYRVLATKNGGADILRLSNEIVFNVELMPLENYRPILQLNTDYCDLEIGKIGLSWSVDFRLQHPLVENYNIYRDNAPITDINSVELLDEVDSFQNNYNDFVNESATYYYKIIATKDGGSIHSLSSNEVSFEVSIPDFETFLPTLQIDNSYTDLEMGHLYLNWTNHVHAELFYIYRDTQPITNISRLDPITSTEWTYQFLHHISYEGTYFYRIIGVKNGGITFTRPSNEISINTEFFNTTPEISKDQIRTDPNIGNLTINWTEVPDADFYHIYRSDSPILNIRNCDVYDTLVGLNFSEQTTVENTFYYKIVAGKNVGGYNFFSNASNELEFSTSFFDSVPELSFDQDLCNSDTGDIAIEWTPVNGAEEYYIYRSISPITDLTYLTEIANISETSYTERITANSTWYYRIMAMKEIDGMKIFSELSNEVNFEIIIPAYMYSPEIKLDNSESSSILGKIKITWEDHPEADGYYVYRDTEPISDVSSLEVYWGLSEPNFTETLFIAGSYYYRIVAHKNEGLSISKQSNQIEYESTYDPFQHPPHISLDEEITNSETGMLSIEWDEHPDAEEYYVYREDSPIVDIPESPYFIVSWNSFFEHINEEGTYYYRVVAVKDEGTSYSDISNEISFTFEFLDENDNNVSEDEGDTDESEGQDQDGDEDNTDTGQNNNTNTGDSDKSGDPDNDGDSGIPGYPIGAFVVLCTFSISSIFAIILKKMKQGRDVPSENLNLK